MYLVEDKGGAIALMCAALLFLGTWPAVMHLLERRGRLLQHTYLDYCISNYLSAIVIALTLGQLGPDSVHRPNFFTQIKQDNGSSVGIAMAGGLVLCLGNLATQYGWPFVGLSVGEIISSCLSVVIGTTLNYFLDGRINRAEVLFPGVACFVVAVWLGAFLHASNTADNVAKTTRKGFDTSVGGELEALSEAVNGTTNSSIPAAKTSDIESGKQEVRAKAGTTEYLLRLEQKRAVKAHGVSPFLGLGIIIFAGLCFAFFSPAFNLATNDQWHTLKDGVPHLQVYTAYFWFSTAFFGLAVVLNLWFLYHPVLGLPKSSFSAYVRDWRGRPWALLSGVLCGFGNGFQFMGGQAAGYAAADAVQALPLVSTLWAVLFFGEYHRSSGRTYLLLGGMIFMFASAVAILMASSGHRKKN